MGVREAVDAAYRDEWGQVLATLIGLTGDWDLAEDCAQEAFVAALTAWPRDGVPSRPGAWLTTTARNRANDRLRRDVVGRAKLRELAVLATLTPEPDEPPVEEIPDDRLRLIFTCCHPALPFEARVALTLRTLCGLTTSEIAKAFLTAEPTMAQRLVRAKRKIAEAGIPYRVPPAAMSSPIPGAWLDITSCRPPGRTCCGGTAASTRPAPLTSRRWNWRRRKRNSATYETD